MANIIQELTWRGLIKQVTNEDKLNNAQKLKKGVYLGFDPTAESLHVGHLVPIILLERFRQAGFKPIALIGGGTGMIGDPSFKSAERVLLTDAQVMKNVQGIKNQLQTIIPKIKVMNNADWLKKLSLIDFLRDVGKDFNLNYLLAKDSIARRIETGLSVTEFLYTMLQAYDFHWLYTNFNCYVQIGGSDQWGNITSGTDYIASQVGKDQSQAVGLTIQLLTKQDGQKFGKTETGTVWLDPKLTSEYEFYQFWLTQQDHDAELMLKHLTFLTRVEITSLINQHLKNPKAHVLQQKLAEKMTEFVHGSTGLKKASKLTEAFFQGTLDQLDSDLFNLALQSLPNVKMANSASVIEALLESGAASSRREAREFIQAQAINFNNQTISDENQKLSSFPLLNDKYLVVKKGKRKYFIVHVK